MSSSSILFSVFLYGYCHTYKEAENITMNTHHPAPLPAALYYTCSIRPSLYPFLDTCTIHLIFK